MRSSGSHVFLACFSHLHVPSRGCLQLEIRPAVLVHTRSLSIPRVVVQRPHCIRGSGDVYARYLLANVTGTGMSSAKFADRLLEDIIPILTLQVQA